MKMVHQEIKYFFSSHHNLYNMNLSLQPKQKGKFISKETQQSPIVYGDVQILSKVHKF